MQAQMIENYPLVAERYIKSFEPIHGKLIAENPCNVFKIEESIRTRKQNICSKGASNKRRQDY